MRKTVQYYTWLQWGSSLLLIVRESKSFIWKFIWSLFETCNDTIYTVSDEQLYIYIYIWKYELLSFIIEFRSVLDEINQNGACIK